MHEEGSLPYSILMELHDFENKMHLALRARELVDQQDLVKLSIIVVSTQGSSEESVALADMRHISEVLHASMDADSQHMSTELQELTDNQHISVELRESTDNQHISEESIRLMDSNYLLEKLLEVMDRHHTSTELLKSTNDQDLLESVQKSNGHQEHLSDRLLARETIVLQLVANIQ